jgi:hypothetical protein
MNDEPTLQSLARLLERLAEEVDGLKAEMTSFKSGLLELEARFRDEEAGVDIGSKPALTVSRLALTALMIASRGSRPAVSGSAKSNQDQTTTHRRARVRGYRRMRSGGLGFWYHLHCCCLAFNRDFI